MKPRNLSKMALSQEKQTLAALAVFVFIMIYFLSDSLSKTPEPTEPTYSTLLAIDSINKRIDNVVDALQQLNLRNAQQAPGSALSLGDGKLIQQSLNMLVCRDISNEKIAANKLFDVLYVRKTITNPPFWVSTHSEKYDRLRHQIFIQGRYYETFLNSMIDTVVPMHGDGYVLDIGANIGWVGLSAAARNVHVIAVEPNPFNIQRMCQSVFLNNFSKMIIVQAGVGDTVSQAYFHEVASNPGESYISETKGDPPGLPMPIMTLDSVADRYDLFQTRKPIYLLKVDVEGFEYRVFQGASKLLSSGFVKGIIVELKNVRGGGDQGMVRGTYNLLLSYGYVPTRILWTNQKESIVLTPDILAKVTRSFDYFMSLCDKVDIHCNPFWELNKTIG